MFAIIHGFDNGVLVNITATHCMRKYQASIKVPSTPSAGLITFPVMYHFILIYFFRIAKRFFKLFLFFIKYIFVR